MRLLPFLALILAGSAHAAITIDGNFSDWSSVSSTATDITGDAPAADVDLTDFKVEYDSATLPTTIFLYYAVDGTNAVTTTYNILIDTDGSNSTGFTFDGTSAGGFDVLLQSGATLDYNGTGGAWGWTNWAWRGPLVSGSEFEVAIPLSYLGVGAGDSLDFVIFTDNANPALRDFMPQDITTGSIQVNVIPEPSALALLTIAGLLLRRRR